MQVGNDNFTLGITEITIKKRETKSIKGYGKYSFNLIHEDKNNNDAITYESLNKNIAVVNEKGEILGVREGTTWVKAKEEDETEHIIQVYVTAEDCNYAPQIKAGEDYAAVLKADGTIWTFGHNNNGELGTGNNRTKDIPEQTNVISTYKEIETGKSNVLAIREDGTVWAFGKNNYGQCGVRKYKKSTKPSTSKRNKTRSANS